MHSKTGLDRGTLNFHMNGQPRNETSPCLFSITDAMTSLLLHRICQIRLIVRSKLSVHKKLSVYWYLTCALPLSILVGTRALRALLRDLKGVLSGDPDGSDSVVEVAAGATTSGG